MSSKEKYDVAIYGHITVDRILTGFSESKTIGAMGNVWGALVLTDDSISIDIKPTAIGQAIILVDKNKTSRLGRGELNITTRENVSPSKSKWHHIMYLNQLEDVSFIKNIDSGIISADMTAGKILNRDFLKYIDYLFISGEDLFDDVDVIAKEVRGWVILHYPEGSYSTNGNKSFTISNKIVENIDVLGAGDFFAASFISKNLHTKDVKQCVNYAHSNTTKLLKKRMNEKY